VSEEDNFLNFMKINKLLPVIFLIGTFTSPLCLAQKQPNLIVYMIDDLGWNQISAKQVTMGTHTGSFITPNIEKIANQGLSFTHAYTQPNCAPSRAAMLSGQYPARVNNGVYVVGNLNRNKKPGITKEQAKFTGPSQRQDVASEAVTIAEALKKNGYKTAHIGKYHVGGHSGDSTMPENQGFDINIGGYTQGHQPTCFSKKGENGWQFTKLGRGDFDRFGEPYSQSYVQKYGIPKTQVGKPKHVCDALADAMEETVQSLAAHPKPFYLQLHAYAVHGPVQSRPDLKETALEKLSKENSRKANLAGFISGMDEVLGRLLHSLKDPNGDGDESDSIAKDTLILFTSDNGGTHFDNLPLKGVKGMFTEGGIRVPLVAYWPGVVPSNTVSNRMVHGIDFYPTLLELAGNQWLPSKKSHPLDGESFAGILRNPSSKDKRSAIFYLFPGYMDARAQPCVAVIDEAEDKRFKLLYFYEANAWELYNLTDDIGEDRNLIKKHPKLASKLSQKIQDWLTQKHPTWKPKYPLAKKDGKPVMPAFLH
jgi:arylsulfatase A-like enzyme